MTPTPFDTYNCHELLDSDAAKATEIIARFGGTAKATRKRKNVVLLIGYFPAGLTYERRVQITSALSNEGVFSV